MSRHVWPAVWLAVILTVIGLQGCSSDAYDADEVNQQTLLVFLPWSGSETSTGLYDSFTANLDSIEAAIVSQKGLTNRRVFVFLSTSATTSTLYEITYNNGCVHETVKDYSGHDYTTAEGIASILATVTAQAPALNYAMIIGGHGTGWIPASSWTGYPANAKRLVFPETRSYGSVSDFDNYATDITALAEGIQAAGVKMQYILMDCCYMADAETAFALRNATNFLIASTSELPSSGLPYKSMWPYLASSAPTYSSIISKFKSACKESAVPYGSLTAIDCRKMEALAEVMKEINAQYTLADSLRDSLQVLDGFSPAMSFDLDDYTRRVCDNRKLYSEFSSCLSDVIKSTTTTDSIYSNLYGTGTYIPVASACGLSFSDPTQNSVALRHLRETEWYQATH